MRKKILIFYISKYSGHFHAANAIEQGLRYVGGDFDVEKINALGYTNPILGKIINTAYIEIIKKKPEIWGNIYDNPEVMKKTEKARAALHRFNMSKMSKLLEKHAPDVILCTQAFPCGMVADSKRTFGRQIPLIGVLTDHAPHSYWLFDDVDYYVVPSEKTAEVLKNKGVPDKKIKPYGIPVDPKFRIKNDMPAVRKKLGLACGNPTVLIMGGTQGLGAMEEVVKSLLRDEGHNYQLLVVAGSNKKLCSRLKKLSAHEKNRNIHILSYVDNIDELMDAADVIVTKAGGMTISEAAVKKLPMLVIKPIPGHERMNTDYFES
ncbi:MAG: glycosyltransferase, partial [Candidatus Omnitrophota bacterium]